MKFISKSVCCLVMENVAFSVPHLRKIISKHILKQSQEFRNEIKTKSEKKRKNKTTGP